MKEDLQDLIVSMEADGDASEGRALRQHTHTNRKTRLAFEKGYASACYKYAGLLRTILEKN